MTDPLRYFIEYHTTIGVISSPYLTAGVTLHKIFEEFYHNIKHPLPKRWGVLDGDGNVIKESLIDKMKVQTIVDYYWTVTKFLERVVPMSSIYNHTDFKLSILDDLFSDGILSLEIFATEESIRYLQTPIDYFLPKATEELLEYQFDSVSAPIKAFLDYRFQDAATLHHIGGDYKNRGDPDGKEIDKFRAYIYAIGEKKFNDVLLDGFKFKNIRAKNSFSPSQGLAAMYWPLMPEYSIPIEFDKFPKVEGIVKKLYTRMMDKSSYKWHKDLRLCPDKYCQHQAWCIGAGVLDRSCAKLKVKKSQHREEKAINLSNYIFTEGEA